MNSLQRTLEQVLKRKERDGNLYTGNRERYEGLERLSELIAKAINFIPTPYFNSPTPWAPGEGHPGCLLRLLQSTQVDTTQF